MKHSFFIFFLLTTFCSTSLTCAMEPGGTNNDDAIFKAIDAAINKQCEDSFGDELSRYVARGLGNLAITAGYVDGSSVSSPFEEKARKTMNTVLAFKSIQLNENIIYALYAKNNHFRSAADHYIARLLNYYHNITCEHLNKAVNSQLEHPVAEINTLAPIIKKYIIDSALKKITHEYSMEFSEGEEIDLFYICEWDTAHLAATSSRFRDYISIWDLFTGKRMHSISKEGNGVDRLCFSTIGTQIAAAMANRNGTRDCKIWHPQSGSLLYTIPCTESIKSLRYTYGSLLNTLTITKSRDLDDKVEIWLLDKKDTPEYRGCFLQTKSEYASLASRATPSYQAGHPKCQLTTYSKLYVTKNICPALYLCERAIDKAQSIEPLKTIEHTQPFIMLTDYEKGLVRKNARNKIDALSAKQVPLPKTNTLLLK